MRKPIVLVYGNCQAEALYTAFQHYPGIYEAFDTLYLRSYNISPDEERTILTDDVLNCTHILLEQVTPLVRLSDRHFFKSAQITTFPALDFNLLWPLRADDPRLRPEPPAFPWGRYPYGDKIINQIVKQGLSGEEAWEQFVKLSSAALPDLERFAEVERRRWMAAERLVDVKMSDIVFDRYRRERLFWTYNHPHKDVLRRLGAKIAVCAGLSPSEDEAYAIFEQLLNFEFGEDFQAPVHPTVAETLKLKWYVPDMVFRRYDQHMPYETFIRAQIAWI